MVNKPLMSG